MSVVKYYYRAGKRFEESVADAFECVGRVVGKHPRKAIMLNILFILLCAIGFLNLRFENDGNKLWVPQDSEAIKDRDYIEDEFGEGYRGGSALFVATGSVGNDIIDLDAFDRIWDIHEDIVNKVKGDGKDWDDLCAIRDDNNNCFLVGPLQFFSGNRDYYNSVINNRKELAIALSNTTFPDGTPVNRDQIFGDFEVDESTDIITKIKGTIQYYQIDGSPISTALDWELGFIDQLSEESGGSTMNVYYFSNRSLDDELGNTVGGDIILMIITYTIMIIITCIVLAKKYDTIHMRTGLSITGILIVIASMIAGYGVCAGLGVAFISIHQVLPFIIVGIGVDDMFIIVAAFDAQDERLESWERLSLALRRCGMSIAYTTVTDVIAFYLGATSALPSIQYFCYYAATSILFNFIFQVCMFCALLCLDADRMKTRHYDLLCCLPCGSTDKTNSTRIGDENNTSQGMEMIPVTEDTELGATNNKAGPIEDAVDTKDINKLTPAQQFMAEYYWPALSMPLVRIGILCAFVGLLAAGIYGCTQVTQGFDVIDLVPDDSYARDYIEEARTLKLFIFEYNVPVEIVYKDIPYHKQATQEEMLSLENGFVGNKFRKYNEGPVTSWIADFTTWVQSSSSPYQSDVNADGYLTDKDLFIEAVQEFLTVPEYTRYDRDIIIKNNQIRASRVSAYHNDLVTPDDQLTAMNDARDYIDDANLSPKPIVYAEAYLNIETEAIIGNELVLNLSLVLVAVIVVSSFVLVRPGAIVLVGIMICMVDVDIIGFMYYWNLKINTVTVVQLVMAVGLVVDYTAHILHYYLQQSFDLSPQERMKAALIEIGPSVLLGCATTFIGILPLAWASSVIFRTFFRMFFFIIVFGATHGLLLLPVVLPSLPFGDITHLLENVKAIQSIDVNESSTPNFKKINDNEDEESKSAVEGDSDNKSIDN